MENKSSGAGAIIAILFGIIILGVLGGASGGNGRNENGDIRGANDEKNEVLLAGTRPAQTDERERERAQREYDQAEKERAEAARYGEQSPYEGLVRISRSSGTRSPFAKHEYITIEALRGNDVDVLVTGWRLESRVTKAYGFIGKGVSVPVLGSTQNIEEPIWLAPGERAIITTGRSPIGISFKENICSGYFEQYQDFTPSISRNCPSPRNEIEEAGIELYDDECYSYVRRLPRCKIITDIPEEDEEPELTSSCRLFVEERLTYNGCTDAHRLDRDFDKGVWRVFLGSYAELWREDRDIIRLLDQNGKTVDLVSYD